MLNLVFRENGAEADGAIAGFVAELGALARAQFAMPGSTRGGFPHRGILERRDKAQARRSRPGPRSGVRMGRNVHRHAGVPGTDGTRDENTVQAGLAELRGALAAMATAAGFAVSGGE